MEFRTINDLNNIIKQNLYKIQYDIDLIVAIPRSGLLPATIISLYLNIPITDIDSLISGKIYTLGTTKIKENWINSIDEARNILIIEDSSASGQSLRKAKEKIKNFKYKDRCKFLTIFVTEKTKYCTDIYFDVCKMPRMFEWNYMHHKGIINACFDIDGVLCNDPTEEENDDGEKYINFIKNVKPNFIPTFKIGYIVTSRLEKYRKETELWLKKNNIKYNKLIMLDLPNKEERIKRNNHGEFKGETYKKLRDTNIFIESNKKQAQEIAAISGKAVFCTENSIFYKEGLKIKLERQLKNIIPKKIKKFLKTFLVK